MQDLCGFVDVVPERVVCHGVPINVLPVVAVAVGEGFEGVEGAVVGQADVEDYVVIRLVVREDEVRDGGANMAVGDLEGFGVRVDIDARAMRWFEGLWESAGDEVGGVGVEVEKWLRLVS